MEVRITWNVQAKYKISKSFIATRLNWNRVVINWLIWFVQNKWSHVNLSKLDTVWREHYATRISDSNKCWCWRKIILRLFSLYEKGMCKWNSMTKRSFFLHDVCKLIFTVAPSITPVSKSVYFTNFTRFTLESAICCLETQNVIFLKIRFTIAYNIFMYLKIYIKIIIMQYNNVTKCTSIENCYWICYCYWTVTIQTFISIWIKYWK